MSSFNSTSPTPTSTSTSTSTSTLTSTSPLLTSSTTPSQRANSKSPTLVSSTHTIPSIASISPSPPATASSSSSTTTTTTTPHPHFSTSTFISCFTQHPKLIKFEQKIQEDPYDIHTWTQLISEFSVLSNPNNKEHIDQLRKFYDEIVQRFPYSTKHWIMYIDFELRVKDHPRVSTLFSKGLRNVHAFELHKVYLNYIKRTHHGDDPPSRTIIKQAYDFVLSKVMHDMASGSIWSDYLTFLKQTQVHSTFEEQQKMEEIRKVYLKAIALPLFNVEQLWRDFDAFENGLNKLTAKKILSEASSSYLIARTCTRTLKQLWDPIDFSSSYHTYPMKPSSPSSLSSSWYTQFNYWKQLISYESSNPLHLEPLQLCARLSWVFWQALHVHDRWPELWFEFGHMVLKLRPHHVGEAIHIFKLGCQMCPGRYVLSKKFKAWIKRSMYQGLFHSLFLLHKARFYYHCSIHFFFF
ncbi:mRNA 3'-end-processing protein rna14 [Coelomomyces lativittatus]|nr:mRNA 3'-end-processing protein rna14 [Coelomomyces lativittatus]KAJ1508162.1 mRNA 3'-end-processing protein rna14 [Coelomomyces lativittatus]KAJ1511507.1 mRNA 3'-end-processing protein rna14 [Coelomomyces lativittatus]